MKIINFSKHLFWDVDVSTLSFEKHKEYIVQRVLEYGVIKDFVVLIKYFSLNLVKDIAISLRSLDNRTLNFIATLTNTPLQAFQMLYLETITKDTLDLLKKIQSLDIFRETRLVGGKALAGQL